MSRGVLGPAQDVSTLTPELVMHQAIGDVEAGASSMASEK